ncbi:hypothetical protein MOF27_15805 [Priestia megaterium]|uniref:hypothetical protein n=1 Tax=Priestia megaterium TaxID=1404 RepID=UPI002282216C|nr:hypothetical protein [Priestia megaterium]MCY9018884.1 hypothetical protein [Priestia megaterium]
MLNNRISSKLLLLFVSLSMLTGVIARISTIMNNPIVKLWKEFFIIGLLCLAILVILPKVRIHTLFLFFAVCLTTVSLIYMNLDINLTVLFYQLKLDLILFLFVIAVYDNLLTLEKDVLENYLKKLFKIFILFTTINAIVIVLEHFFSAQFMAMLGFKDEQWGADTGIKIVSTDGIMRSPGLLTYFVPAGTLMLMAFIVTVETRKLFKMRRRLRLILLCLFTVSMVFTTYKTAIIGFIFYLTLKLIEFIFRKYAVVFTTFITIGCFIIFFISTHFMSIYYFVDKYSPSIAYNSILIRILQHHAILDSMETTKQVLFGVGMGLNGTFGLDKTAFNINPLPTDSTYIYLASNYGFLGVFAFLFIFIWVAVNLFKTPSFDVFGMRYIAIYTISIEFFYNNFISSFPTNIIAITMMVIPFVKGYHVKAAEKKEKARKRELINTRAI